MTNQEIEVQLGRIAKYRQLKEMHDEIQAAIKAITEIGGKNPFTSDYRESRQVKSIHISFTPTRGGAPAVDMGLVGLYIEAPELGRQIEKMLRAKLEPIKAEMASI